jgi:hypothetical protein
MFVCYQTHPGGEVRCFTVPSVKGPPPGPPVDEPTSSTDFYSHLISDACILASVQEWSGQISDKKVRQAIRDGVRTAVKAMQQRAGDAIQIKE